MRKRFKKKLEIRYLVILLLVGFTIIFGVLFLTIKDNRKLTFIEKGIKDTGLLLYRIIYKPVEVTKDYIDTKKAKDNLYTKYKDMLEKYEEFDLVETKYNELEKELEEFESILNLNTRLSEGTYINSTIINRDVGYWYNSVTIDKGSQNGVEEGQAVINSKGLVGYVTATSYYNSTVKLLTREDSNHKISIKIEVGESYVYGLLTSYNHEKNLFLIEGISENTGLPQGARIITTGLGNNYPSGVLVGYVDYVVPDNFDLAKTVYMKSAVNFENLGYVTVLKREMEV